MQLICNWCDLMFNIAKKKELAISKAMEYYSFLGKEDLKLDEPKQLKEKVILWKNYLMNPPLTNNNFDEQAKDICKMLYNIENNKHTLEATRD